MLLVVTAAGCVVERGIVSSCALSMWFIWICCFIFFIDCSGEEANRAQKKRREITPPCEKCCVLLAAVV